MLQISPTAMAALERSSFLRYQSGLVPHLQQHFPFQAKYLGSDGLLRLIGQACANAESFEFRNKRSLCLWTDLSMMFGIGFHDDPQLPWAARIIDACRTDTERVRINRLWKHAAVYQQYVLGDEIFPERAYLSERQIRALGEVGMQDFSYDDKAYLRLIWPEKSYLLGSAGFAQLQDISNSLTRKYGIGDIACRNAIMVHAFLFGHAFAIDPQFPWLLSTLESYSESSSEEWLRRFIKSFDEHLLNSLEA